MSRNRHSRSRRSLRNLNHPRRRLRLHHHSLRRRSHRSMTERVDATFAGVFAALSVALSVAFSTVSLAGHPMIPWTPPPDSHA